MDEYDNITRMPHMNRTGNEQVFPRLNLRALSLLSEDGHLTITFWLLAAAIVVSIYLVIEMLEQSENVLPPPVAQAEEAAGKENHQTPARRTRTSTKEVASGSQD